MKLQYGIRTLALAVLAMSGATQAQVAIVNTNDLAGGPSSASRINDQGWVIGSITHHGILQDPFLYANGTLTNLISALPTGGTMPPWAAAAGGISASGSIVGSYFMSIEPKSVPYVYANGVVTELRPQGGVTPTSGSAINSSGQVVGQAQTAGGQSRGYVLTDGNLVVLDTLGGAGQSAATAINNKGQVVGSASATVAGRPYPMQHAFLYEDGVMQDLGTPGDYYGFSSARDINDAGQVVGEAQTPLGSFAFLYSDGVMKSLGSLSGLASAANAISETGIVVGTFQRADGINHAFIYTEEQGMVDLNSLLPADSGWVLTGAGDINAQGIIVGSGLYKGVQAGFILSGAVLSVPEPSAFALLALGLGAATLTARRRQVRA